MVDRYKRNNGRYNSDYRLKDLYDEYKAKCKTKPYPYSVFSKVIKEYNQRIIKYIIYENFEFRMPYRLGYLRIQKVKTKPILKSNGIVDKKFLPPDWDATLKLWKKKYPNKTMEEIKEIKDKPVIRHFNDHTNGWRARFFWDKLTSTVKHQNWYIFKATRTNKNLVSALIKEGNKILYYE